MNKSKPLNFEVNIINIYGRFYHTFFIAQSGPLMLFREYVCLDSASRTKPTNALCAQSAVFP
jgi:hypothetical protein